MEDMKNIFNIDTSGLTTNNLSDIGFEESLRERTQEILNKIFNIAEKRNIKRSPSSLNFACPFCRDSATDNKKKRAHLILSGKSAGYFYCFNCGQSMKFNKFFKSFDTQLSLSEIKYINDTYNSSLLDASSKSAANNLTSLIVNKSDAYEYAISRELIKTSFNLTEIAPNTYVHKYLVNRCQYNMYERFLYSEKYKQLYILNLIDDRVLGMQIRNLNYKGSGPKYLTITIEKLRNVMLNDNSAIPEHVSKLSCVFNIFNVDFSNVMYKPVLLTEGPFDAFLLPNCIAVSGASKTFNINFPFWYIYDNDQTGSEHSMSVLKQGYKTFMWKKFKEHYNIPDINPYITEGNKRKWDITDIKKYFRDNNIQEKLLWSPYFTNSMLDGLYI